MAYEARCHCGAVTVGVAGDLPDKAVVCNCSHCRAKGLVLAAVPGPSVTITSGEDSLETYQFNRHVIDHRFCTQCGTQPFAQGKGPDGSPMAMINLRCVPEVDLEAIEKVPFDGASI
ncbi:MAG TPA: GFA family protein [Sphingomicrobium sp.]|nr:GFA family protein [Sphingomicrobium sp.]